MICNAQGWHWIMWEAMQEWACGLSQANCWQKHDEMLYGENSISDGFQTDQEKRKDIALGGVFFLFSAPHFSFLQPYFRRPKFGQGARFGSQPPEHIFETYLIQEILGLLKQGC